MLYFVGTPIGNLQDMSFRAVSVLKDVDEIACEDTRHSLPLLNAFDIHKPLFSYHKFNEKEVSVKIVEKLKSGKNIAVITDAGLPVISDPGNVLVNELIKEGLEYTVVPSGSAFTSALLLSGLSADKFTFLGFLPPKAGERKELLNKYTELDTTLIFYSAPHDIIKDINDIYGVLGDRTAVAVKEITKIHETVIRFNLKDGLGVEPKGEYVLLVEGKKKDTSYLSMTVEEHIKIYTDKGIDKKEAIKLVAKERGVSKSSIYKFTIEK